MGDLYILGINAYDHDVAACLIKNGEIVVGIEKERVTRVKHASGFYGDTVGYCLKAAGVTLDDIDLVVRNCYMLPVSDMERRLVYSDQVRPPVLEGLSMKKKVGTSEIDRNPMRY